jgi:steroid 5-alpha reductase family enzyme
MKLFLILRFSVLTLVIRTSYGSNSKLNSKATLLLRGGDQVEPEIQMSMTTDSQLPMDQGQQVPTEKSFTGESLPLTINTERKFRFHWRPSDLTFASATSQNARLRASLDRRIRGIREQVRQQLSTVPDDWKDRSKDVIEKYIVPISLDVANKMFSQGQLQWAGIYGLALLGSCSGFHLFLYFITVGYALGVTLPVIFALYIQSQQPIDNCTALHSGLILLWGIRAAIFFLYREYISWPQLHTKVVEVNRMARFHSKFLCWLVYSFFYACMSTPCIRRLYSPTTQWGNWGRFALALQSFGLLIETIADYQKCSFKAKPGNRYAWCDVGLFRYSTFPNYLGEGMFWYGTFGAGMAALTSPHDWALASLGLLFLSMVLKGAVQTLGAKHWRKYSQNPAFVEHRRTHTIFGPKPWSSDKKPAELQPSE